jgi:hypothetical protein
MPIIKKLFKKTTSKPKAKNVLDDTAWAEKEIQEVENRLVDLMHRLHDGISQATDSEVISETLIKQHTETLERAKMKKSELTAKVEKVDNMLKALAELK